MRLLLALAVALVALLAAGWWGLPLLASHAPALIGLLGVGLLVVARLWPSKPKCEGHHCSGCRNH
ncbi:hypothetical protein ACQP2F_46500 (plasmid) [Actinoplanes sp. CA-030573]|uniref:hypothetical protein n=1 Tax=Actinoplanes sp. CA-030573 TaxID=3239898 RepID=UPI003D9096E9